MTDVVYERIPGQRSNERRAQAGGDPFAPCLKLIMLDPGDRLHGHVAPRSRGARLLKALAHGARRG